MKIALTGASGLVGSRFFDVLKGKYEIIPISSSYGVDITDRKKIHKFLEEKNPALIVHLAAKTNVDGCEEDKKEDLKKLEEQKIYSSGEVGFESLNADLWKGSASAFGINVAGTKNLADYASKKDIKMIYVSTDFVFNGDSDKQYSEESEVDPINWYGQTKYWGEQTIPDKSLIARISYPYGRQSNIKKDLVWVLINLLSERDVVELVSDQVITPTYIEDIVAAFDFLIEKDINGLIDVVGNNFLSPYEIGVAIAREFNIPETKINTTTREKLYKNRAKRPFKVMLKNDKLKNLGFEMTDFFMSLARIKKSL